MDLRIKKPVYVQVKIYRAQQRCHFNFMCDCGCHYDVDMCMHAHRMLAAQTNDLASVQNKLFFGLKSEISPHSLKEKKVCPYLEQWQFTSISVFKQIY